MSKPLVAYFSASGQTAKKAKLLAQAANADLFEIQPVEPYSRTDLSWVNKKSRSSREMKDPAARPEIANTVENIDAYDTIFLGFPIWWYTAPRIINTFLEGYDFSGKTIVLFATSGGSGFGSTADDLKPSAPGATILDGKMLNGRMSADDLKPFAEQYS